MPSEEFLPKIHFGRWAGFRVLAWCAIRYLWAPQSVEQHLRTALTLRHRFREGQL